MKILALMMKYDYGDPERGYSFEYDTFYRSFVGCAYDVDLYDYMDAYKKGGSELVGQEITDLVSHNTYDLFFTVLFNTEISQSTLNMLYDMATPSIAWMSDDKWRWKDYGSRLCWNFNYVVTTDPDAVAKYNEIGYKNVIRSQWAVNPQIYMKMEVKKDIDVSFIGQINPWRQWVVKRLCNKGVNIDCYGYGWKNGRVTQEEMVKIYNRSKISLNISNSVQWDYRYLLCSFANLKDSLRSKKRQEDIKARFFEVLACNSLLVSYNVEHLGDYLVNGIDLVTYQNVDDLIDKVYYYLEHDNERENISNAGYAHVLKSHTYEARFSDLFSRISPYNKK